MRTVRFTTPRSPPKRDCHSLWLSTTTGGPPSASSSGSSARPRSGRACSTEKVEAVTSAPDAGPAMPVPESTLYSPIRAAPSPLKLLSDSRHTA
jgi:hypothetical protein